MSTDPAMNMRHTHKLYNLLPSLPFPSKHTSTPQSPFSNPSFYSLHSPPDRPSQS